MQTLVASQKLEPALALGALDRLAFRVASHVDFGETVATATDDLFGFVSTTVTLEKSAYPMVSGDYKRSALGTVEEVEPRLALAALQVLVVYGRELVAQHIEPGFAVRTLNTTLLSGHGSPLA